MAPSGDAGADLEVVFDLLAVVEQSQAVLDVAGADVDELPARPAGASKLCHLLPLIQGHGWKFSS